MTNVTRSISKTEYNRVKIEIQKKTMSKPLKSYPEGKQRDEAAQKRAANPQGGIGKVAAQDYLKRRGVKVTKAEPAKPEKENEGE